MSTCEAGLPVPKWEKGLDEAEEQARVYLLLF